MKLKIFLNLLLPCMIFLSCKVNKSLNSSIDSKSNKLEKTEMITGINKIKHVKHNQLTHKNIVINTHTKSYYKSSTSNDSSKLQSETWTHATYNSENLHNSNIRDSMKTTNTITANSNINKSSNQSYSNYHNKDSRPIQGFEWILILLTFIATAFIIWKYLL